MSASIQGGAAAATEGVDVAAARRPGSIRHVALREPTAIAGLAIIAFFVLVALLSPILVTGDPKEKVGPIFGPPSASYPLGLDGGGATGLAFALAAVIVCAVAGVLLYQIVERPLLRGLSGKRPAGQRHEARLKQLPGE